MRITELEFMISILSYVGFSEVMTYRLGMLALTDMPAPGPHTWALALANALAHALMPTPSGLLAPKSVNLSEGCGRPSLLAFPQILGSPLRIPSHHQRTLLSRRPYRPKLSTRTRHYR